MSCFDFCDVDFLPYFILLDTCVVQNLYIFKEYIFNGYLSEEMNNKLNKLGNNFRQDIYALGNLLDNEEHALVIPYISNLSLYELSKTGNEIKRDQLMKWGFKLLDTSKEVDVLYSDDVDYPIDMKNNFIQFSPRQTIFTDFLKDKIDRLLLGEFWKRNFNAFITMDYKTILKYRDRLKKEGINVLSPSIWLKLRARESKPKTPPTRTA